MNPDPDLALLEAWRAGDRKAAQALLHKYYRLLHQIVVTKVPEDAVDDVVQQIITALVERRDKFRADATFRTYALAIARNVLGDFFRKRSRHPLDLVSVFASSVRDLGAGPTTLIFQGEHQRLFLEALRSLPLDDQFVIELHYWENMTGPELAQVFDMELSAIRSRLRRAKERLGAQMHELADHHRELADTLTDLDAWARRLRDSLKPYLDQRRQARAGRR